MLQTSQLQIDLSAIAHNLKVLRQMVGPAVGLCPILKADAYGLGAAGVVRQLIESGADMLAVYTLHEATSLAELSTNLPVLVLMPVRDLEISEGLYRLLINGRLHLTLHDFEQLRCVAADAQRLGLIVPVHLEIDTGMSRGGCALCETGSMLRQISESPGLRLAGLMTHFATADNDVDFARDQLDQFNAIIARWASLIPDSCIIHAANSSATLRGEAFHKSMVRIGLAWAGYGSEQLVGGPVVPQAAQLCPSLTWASQLVHLKAIEPGTPVGYGSAWHANRRSVIGLVPVGYADGYPVGIGAVDARQHGAVVGIPLRSGSGCCPVFAPVIGAINMDQIMVDLTDVHVSIESGQIGVGTPVELISPDANAPNYLPRLAKLAGTIPYDLICRLNPRIPRSYTQTAGRLQAAAPAAALGVG